MPCGCQKNRPPAPVVTKAAVPTPGARYRLTLPAGMQFPDGSTARTYTTKPEAVGANVPFAGKGTIQTVPPNLV